MKNLILLLTLALLPGLSQADRWNDYTEVKGTDPVVVLRSTANITNMHVVCIKGYSWLVTISNMKNTQEFHVNTVQMMERTNIVEKFRHTVPVKC